MNGQFQKTPAISMIIPEDRKHQIIVVLGQMISQRLTETKGREEHQARKDCEDFVMRRHGAVDPRKLSWLKT